VGGGRGGGGDTGEEGREEAGDHCFRWGIHTHTPTHPHTHTLHPSLFHTMYVNVCTCLCVCYLHTDIAGEMVSVRGQGKCVREHSEGVCVSARV
jgi:hypothetical protein